MRYSNSPDNLSYQSAIVYSHCYQTAFLVFCQHSLLIQHLSQAFSTFSTITEEPRGPRRVCFTALCGGMSFSCWLSVPPRAGAFEISGPWRRARSPGREHLSRRGPAGAAPHGQQLLLQPLPLGLRLSSSSCVRLCGNDGAAAPLEALPFSWINISFSFSMSTSQATPRCQL